MSIKTNLAAAALAVPLSIGAVPPVLNNFFGATEAQAQTFKNKKRVTIRTGAAATVVRASRNSAGPNNGCGSNRPISDVRNSVNANNRAHSDKGVTLEEAGGGLTPSSTCKSNQKATLVTATAACGAEGHYTINKISGSFTLVVKEGPACKDTNVRAERQSVKSDRRKVKAQSLRTRNGQVIAPYQRGKGRGNFKAMVGDKIIVKGMRSSDCGAAPSWASTAKHLPSLSNGVFHNAGTGLTKSSNCPGSYSQARLIGFTVTGSGKAGGNILEDYIHVNALDY
jgi:hypothetical protein